MALFIFELTASDDLWCGSDTIFIVKCLTDLVNRLYVDVYLMEKVLAYGGPPSRTLVVLYPELAIFAKYEMINVWGTVALFIHLSKRQWLCKFD